MVGQGTIVGLLLSLLWHSLVVMMRWRSLAAAHNECPDGLRMGRKDKTVPIAFTQRYQPVRVLYETVTDFFVALRECRESRSVRNVSAGWISLFRWMDELLESSWSRRRCIEMPRSNMDMKARGSNSIFGDNLCAWWGVWWLFEAE